MASSVLFNESFDVLGGSGLNALSRFLNGSTLWVLRQLTTERVWFPLSVAFDDVEPADDPMALFLPATRSDDTDQVGSDRLMDLWIWDRLRTSTANFCWELVLASSIDPSRVIGRIASKQDNSHLAHYVPFSATVLAWVAVVLYTSFVVSSNCNIFLHGTRIDSGSMDFEPIKFKLASQKSTTGEIVLKFYYGWAQISCKCSLNIVIIRLSADLMMSWPRVFAVQWSVYGLEIRHFMAVQPNRYCMLTFIRLNDL